MSEMIDDNMSAFSERLVEREGVTRNPDLILPEDEDDAFFEQQSNRSQSMMSRGDRRSAV